MKKSFLHKHLQKLIDHAWLITCYLDDQVSEVKGDDVVCVVKNSATLAGSLFTLHISQVHIDLPTLSDKDKQVSSFQISLTQCFLSCFGLLPWLISHCLNPLVHQVISSWGMQNKIDFLSLSYTRHAEDVRQVSPFPSSRSSPLDTFYSFSS